MSKDIPITEFRTNLPDYANLVEEEGETLRVIRHSKPVFYVVKIGDESPGEEWETIIDFTEGGASKGIQIDDALKALRRINR